MRLSIDVTRTTEDFSEFFRREYPRLARACLLLTSDRTEAEELAQEALARAYPKWSDIATMASPVGYVYRTALNLNRKRLRRLAVRARRAVAPRPTPDAVDAIEDRLDLLRGIRALPRGQREALVMIEWLDLDVEEAASLLRIAPASVRGRLHRARQTLRERFGGNDE
ncbi:MAG: sigma-70 family RNA polymerase sigma factor [Actinomycetota bacterium]